MVPMTAEQVAQAVQGTLINAGTQPVEARHVTTDSRQAQQGGIFVAIAGERVNGHDYVQSAAQHGAEIAIVEHEVEHVDITQVVVSNSVDALGLLAKANIERRRELNTPFTVVAITGSVGKTTTKDLLSHVLSDLGPCIAPVGSFNNEIGLPLTALRVQEDTRYLIAEMGANHVGEIAHLTSLVPPDIAVVLKVGVAHVGEFGSVERIAQAKSELIQGLRPNGVSILNADDEHVQHMSQIAPGQVVWFGVEHADDHEHYMCAKNVRIDDYGKPEFLLCSSQGEEESCVLGLHGKHNVMNALAASAVAHYEGMSVRQIAQDLSLVSTISPHRMQVTEMKFPEGMCVIIDDSFNANPDSMKAGIDALATWGNAQQEQPYRIAILGAMLELGDNERNLHRSIGAYVIEHGIDALIAVGAQDHPQLIELAQCFVAGAQQEQSNQVIHIAQSAQEADVLLRSLVEGHDAVVALVKGSHASGLSTLIEQWNMIHTSDQEQEEE